MATEINDAFRRVAEELRSGDPAKKEYACKLLDRLLDEQGQDEASMGFGQFPKEFGGGKGDLNMALFKLPQLLAVLELPPGTVPAELVGGTDRAVRRALVAAQRRWDEEIFDLHRDHKAYTNIFLLYIRALLVGGCYLGDERLTRCGVAQWKRWLSHVAYSGIDEFVSDYFNVDYEALLAIHDAAPDDTMRGEVARVLDHLSIVQHATTHPHLRLPVCGSARCYRRFLPGGSHEGASIEAGMQGNNGAGYTPPDKVVHAYRERCFPYEASGRATSVPFFYKSWQDEQAALGSMTGGNYFWQQIHCTAAVGESADAREVLFMPGSYTIANGYVRQEKARALCLFSRRINTYLRTQKFAHDSDIAQEFGAFGIGMTDGWKIEQDGGRLVFRAYGHTVTVDSFVLEEETVRPVGLTSRRVTSLSQGRFHRTPTDMTEWCVPEESEWFGCVVTITPGKALPPVSGMLCRREESRLELAEDGGLTLRVFLQPAGGETELYESDWRTCPLFECPEQTLWPGELVRKEAL